MKVIVGLGNPTKEYKNTFHNIGFAVIDKLQEEIKPSRVFQKFHSFVFRGDYNGVDYLLVLPQTYMNLSGKAIISCLSFYKIPYSQLLVVYDNLDLALEKIRYKKQGGHGGHNGLKDIIQKLSSTEFARISIGIGRPTSKISPAHYVLQKIPINLQAIMEKSVEKATLMCKKFLLSKELPISIIY